MIKFELKEITDTLTIDGLEYQIFRKDQLTGLIDKLKEYQGDITELKSAVTNILKLFGLLDETTGTIKTEIQNGEESYFKHILKALNKTVGLLMMAQVSKKSQAELEIQFAFIKTLIPIINKHAGK
jgi:hypothetical protein